MDKNKLEELKEIIQPFTKSGSNRSESDLSTILSYISNTALIKQITEESSSSTIPLDICKALTIEVFEPGQRVVNFGEIGKKFYIILSGKLKALVPEINSSSHSSSKNNISALSRKNSLLEIDFKRQRSLLRTDLATIKEITGLASTSRKTSMIFDLDFLKHVGTIEDLKSVCTMGPGESFGELALISEKPRAATIECQELSVLAVLTKQEFTRILSAEAERNLNAKVAFLESLPLLAGVSKPTLQKLSYYFKKQRFVKGQHVYRDNLPVDMIYFVDEGEFQVYRNKEQLKKVIEVPSGFLSSQKSLIKIENARDVKQCYQLQVAIRGRCEMLGYEEYLTSQNLRNHTCRCISLSGSLYCITVTVFFI